MELTEDAHKEVEHPSNKGISFDGTVNIPTIITAGVMLITVIVTFVKADEKNLRQDEQIERISRTLEKQQQTADKQTELIQQCIITQTKLATIVEERLRNEVKQQK